MFTTATNEFLEHEWRHLAGFLNAARITGYLRRGKGRTIYLVQNNLASLALPIHLERNCILPDVPDNTPLSARCHVVGEVDAQGNRYAALKAFDLVTPNPEWLPPDYVFNHPVPEDAIQIDFSPPQSGIIQDDDGSNLVRVAGYAASIALESVDVGLGVNGKMSFLLVQANSEQAIPVRCYGRLASAFGERIEEGTPIQIAASFRVGAKRTGELDAKGKSFMATTPYLHAIAAPMFAGEEMIEEVVGKAVQAALQQARPARRRKPDVETGASCA